MKDYIYIYIYLSERIEDKIEKADRAQESRGLLGSGLSPISAVTLPKLYTWPHDSNTPK